MADREAVIDKVIEIAERVGASEGIEIVDVDLVGGGRNRGSDLNRNTERQQRDCDQRFAKAKCRSNQSGDKHHEEDMQNGRVKFFA